MNWLQGLLARKHKTTEQLFTEASASGLFDADWYQARYGRQFESPELAFRDYLHKSRFAPVHPSPGFDSETYIRQNMDVYYDQQSPLAHYLKHGAAEGRSISPVVERWQPQHSLQLSSELSDKAKKLRVALCLHVFYEDFIQRYAQALDSFPITVDVLLTVASEEIAMLAKVVLSQHPRVDDLQVVVVPNRGRNFAPWMVEYSDVLQKYDLFFHLHSKKSLYSGKEQTQWADYLTEFLLADPAVVTRCLNAFAANATLGVFYPTTFWMMPPWVNHLTMNKPFVKLWQQRFGIEVVHDFLCYPVGGMFCARPDAVQGIISPDWEYGDFPEEPLPNDGSWLHALERIIGVLAEHRGYQQFFYNPSNGVFTTDQRFITAAYRVSLNDYLPLLQAHTHLSFDVFDTLVRRVYTEPDYAKFKLGKLLVQQGYIESAQAFVNLRNSSEFEQRKATGFQGDVRLPEIYVRVGEALGVDDSLAQTWADHEFELDLAMICPKDEMVELFNHLAALGHVIWVISDTYYSRVQVGKMLRKCGVAAAYRLLVSSEEQKRKDNGTMWLSVKDDLVAEGVDQHIHIGDNVVADAQRPGDLGLKTLHILHPVDKWHACGMPGELSAGNDLDEQRIIKWGGLISKFGRSPFIGE